MARRCRHLRRDWAVERRVPERISVDPEEHFSKLNSEIRSRQGVERAILAELDFEMGRRGWRDEENAAIVESVLWVRETPYGHLLVERALATIRRRWEQNLKAMEGAHWK